MPPGAGPDWVEAEVIEVCPAPTGRRNPSCGRMLSSSGSDMAPVGCPCSRGRPRPSPWRAASMPGRCPGRGPTRLAADLLAAAGSRLAEVRITTLANGVFCAAAVVAGPGGDVEVDARPSDAVNLAVLAGAPILVDAAILDDPVVDSHPEWEQYPARLADLAAEERQRRAGFQARVAQARESPGPS